MNCFEITLWPEIRESIAKMFNSNNIWIKCFKIYVLLASLLILFNIFNYSDGSILDWIWPDKNAQYYQNKYYTGSTSLPVIPFELSETNDQFIMDMSKALGMRLSDMDFCQQRVILSLKSSCNTLSDEELGKLAIALMNCQHIIEKRNTIDCSAKVFLSDCVSQMNDDTKVSYGHVLARAKSVCLAIRQDQFRGMTELTINKLMSQVDRLRTSQNQLEQITLNSVDELTDSQVKLLNKQNELLKLADVQKLSTEANLKEMLKEKATLDLFIGNLKYKIEEGLNDLSGQNSETKLVLKKLLQDLVQINEVAAKISGRFSNIEKLSNEHEKNTNENFEEIMQKLKHTNDIVQNFSNKITAIKEEFYSHLEWLQQILGADEYFSYRFGIILSHMLYLLLGMICLVFVNASITNRYIITSIVLTSLCCNLYDVNINLITLLKILVGFVIVNLSIGLGKKFDLIKKVSGLFKFEDNGEVPVEEIPNRIERNSFKETARECNNNEYDNEEKEIVVNQSRSYSTYLNQSRPITRRISGEFEKQSNYSRSSTPLNDFSQYDLGRCKAITRNGSRCQLMTPSSCTDFCRIHERSSRER